MKSLRELWALLRDLRTHHRAARKAGISTRDFFLFVAIVIMGARFVGTGVRR
jgi:hypothetical protein